jgi:DNA-binding MarR family transcriptional regulator
MAGLPEGNHDGSSGGDLPYLWHILGEDALTQRLLLVAKMIERVTSRKLNDEFGISVAQWRVLAFVCISGPASGSFIGEAAEVDQAEISRAVKTLTDRGLVTRDFQHGSRKTLIVSPTAAGTELFVAIREQRRSYFSSIIGQLDVGQKQEMKAILNVLVCAVVTERGGTQ